MAGIDVKFRLKIPREIKNLRQVLGKSLQKVTAQALNTTATQGRTQSIRSIATELNVRKGLLREKNRIVIIKTFKSIPIARMKAIIKYSNKPLGIIDIIGVRQIKRKGGGVAVTIKKRKGRRLIRRAFIATMPTGHRGVFVRTNPRRASEGKRDDRLPIRELFTSSPNHIAQYPSEIKKMVTFLNSNLNRIFINKAKFELSRIARRGNRV